MYKQISKTVLLLVAILSLSACSGLPDHLAQQVEKMPAQLQQKSQSVSDAKVAFDMLDKHSEWSFFKPYYEREKWSDYPVRARESLNAAETLYKQQIVPMADRDDPDESNAFADLIKQFNGHMRDATAFSKKADERIKFLVTARDTAPTVYKKAQAEMSEMKQLTSQLDDRADKTIELYPNKKKDISERIEELRKLNATADTSMNVIEYQYSRVDSGEADYALFGDSSVTVSKTLNELKAYHKKTTSKLSELYRSYTRVLADQKIDYFVVIGRASWCDGEYCGEGDTDQYPAVKVDEKVFEYFDNTNIDTIATLRRSWGSDTFKIAVPQAMWQALNIQPKFRWNSSYDDADYWVEQTYTKSYHKYIEIENDQTTETGWKSVNEDYFWKHQEDLGMAIVTKPYGYYVEDTIKVGQPVGIATIAEPSTVNGVAHGSNQYGEWKQDSQGNSFWHYYGQYRFFGDLLGGSGYYYDDYRDYRSYRNQPYYGRNDQWGTYGANTYNNTRYSKSDYARRNPGEVTSARTSRTSASSRTTSSVRGAGSTSRGRGPGGSGK